MLELLFITGDMHCVWVCVCVFFLLWISITLSSEAQAFGHGFS